VIHTAGTCPPLSKNARSKDCPRGLPRRFSASPPEFNGREPSRHGARLTLNCGDLSPLFGRATSRNAGALAITAAVDELTRDLSASSPEAAKRELYLLLKEGIKVSVPESDSAPHFMESFR
jgi:hypothetical protein